MEMGQLPNKMFKVTNEKRVYLWPQEDFHFAGGLNQLVLSAFKLRAVLDGY